MKTEQSYGVVVVLKEEEYKFLLVFQENPRIDNWSFPKGHQEEGETPMQTALRELEEETGIKKITLLDFPLIHEEYEITRNGEKVLKFNDYFIGLVVDKNIKIQDGEIGDYKWADFNEAMETFNYESRKETLVKANEYIKK
jgi:8-oxo-dGTP pyrophosphatase MutT (NUDIX family)